MGSNGCSRNWADLDRAIRRLDVIGHENTWDAIAENLSQRNDGVGLVVHCLANIVDVLDLVASCIT